MDELKKKIVPGFQSNEEISAWVKTLDPELKSHIKKSALIMKQLDYLKWGTSTSIEVKNEIQKIVKSN